MKQKNQEKGITLIALVITIIVLVILAGITIGNLTSDNGVIKEARTAKEKTEKAGVEEQIDTAIIKAEGKHRNATMDDIIEELKNEKVITNSSQVDKKTGAVTSDLGYLIEGKLDDYIVIPGKPNSDGYFTETSTIDGTSPSAYNPTIPSGFKPIDTDSSSWGVGDTVPTTDSVNKGLVITDGTSEFVWVPVDTPSDMYGIDTAGKKWGKLYNFGSTSASNSALNWTEKNGKISIAATSGDGSNREPDVVTGSGSSFDADPTYLSAMNSILREINVNYANSDAFKTALEADFSNMITSVEKYKGFYVGRYETSLNASGVAQSKQGKTSANANDEDTTRWYGLYARQKLYSTESVQGSMIWGSQYDAMMKWMQGNGINVATPTPTDLSIGVTSKNTTRVTGGANDGQTVSKDKLSNIYDLLGNSREWTLEAYDTSYRVSRGGTYNSSYVPQSRGSNYPYNRAPEYGSRLTLYVR